MTQSAAQHQFIAERQHAVLDTDQKWKCYTLYGNDGVNFKTFLVYSLTEVHLTVWHGEELVRITVMPIIAARTLWRILTNQRWSRFVPPGDLELRGIDSQCLATVRQGRGRFTK